MTANEKPLPQSEGFRLKTLDLKLPVPAAGPVVATSWGKEIRRADCDALSREIRSVHEATGRKANGIAFIERDYNPPVAELKAYMNRQWPEMATHIQSLHICFAFFEVKSLDGILEIVRIAASKIEGLSMHRSTRWMAAVADLTAQATTGIGAGNIHVHGSVITVTEQLAKRNVGAFAGEVSTAAYAREIHLELLAKGFKVPPPPTNAWK